MTGIRFVELPQKIEQGIEGAAAAVFVTHVGRASSGLPRVRASIWNGSLVANGVLEPDVNSDRWRFARAATSQAPEVVPDARAVVAALMRCAEALHQQRVLETALALAAADAAGAPDDGLARPSQATRLVALAEEGGAVFFHSAEGEAYATVPVAPPGGGTAPVTNEAGPEAHLETWLLRAKGFRHWLARRYYLSTGGATGSQALQDALGVLQGRALYDGEQRAVHTRMAEHEGAIYLDLADAAWRVVRIAPDEPGGFRVLPGAEAPVRFRRPRGLLPLPEPAPGGMLDELRAFINAPDDDRWRLLVAWLVAALRPSGPYPALALYGEQGSAKSTAARILRALVDPNSAALRAQPREPRDLMIAATNGWVVALDNLSAVQGWLSDALCRLATGGGFAVRELYSDSEETLFDAQRPVLFTGIEELATRGDLLDRALVVTLPAIPEEARRTEGELWPAFEAARPRVLGALLSAVATGLARLPETRLERLPRMADFALWVSAAEPALWPEPGAFLRAYAGNRADAREAALEASPVVPGLRAVAAESLGGRWEGTATELLRLLSDKADERALKAEGWPKNGHSLSGVLRRLAPDLRATGLNVQLGLKGRKAEGRRRLLALQIEPEGARKPQEGASEPTPSEIAEQAPVAPGASTHAESPLVDEGASEQGGENRVHSVHRVHLPDAPGGEEPVRVDAGGTRSGPNGGGWTHAIGSTGEPLAAPVHFLPGEVDGVDAVDAVLPSSFQAPFAPPADVAGAAGGDGEDF